MIKFIFYRRANVKMDLQKLLKDPPKLHLGGSTSWGLAEEVLTFIDGHVGENSKTLETGAGLSTILFASKGTEHTCVMPDEDIVKRIRDYSDKHQISLRKVTFVIDKSESALPALTLSDLDMVLIDGRHGFPAPFIDWYYTAPFLRLNGLLIVDDTQLWTGDILRKFLLSEPEWSLKKDFPKRAAVFAKLGEGSEAKEWCYQPYTVKNSDLGETPEGHPFVSRLRRIIHHVRAGEFATLKEKFLRNTIG